MKLLTGKFWNNYLEGYKIVYLAHRGNDVIQLHTEDSWKCAVQFNKRNQKPVHGTYMKRKTYNITMEREPGRHNK